MAYNVVVLPTARKEFQEITEYLAFQGKATLGSFLNEYERQLNLIASGSVTYRLSRFAEIAELGYRMAPVNSYLFLYVLEDDTVTIAHFFHQSQDYARLV